MRNKPTQKNNTNYIYGKHPVICALSNPRRKSKTLFTTQEAWQEIKHNFSDIRTSISFRDKRDLDRILPSGTNHQNFILEVETIKQPSIEEIIEQDENKAYSCLVILDQVTDPHNIGAIIRSSAAFGASAVILPDHHSPKENSTIAKCAAGAIETTPLISVTNISQTIKALKQEGYWIIGLDGNTNKILAKEVFSKKIVIIMGSEEKGMRKLTRDNCDFLVKIPTSSQVESLNVSNAASICLYEFSKFSNT